ncbi:MAG: tRNA (N(6)-L-threonylcarbamoyladenosine(37)-C(2))-methylthiotransferase MtaB [Terriglobia bacterium]|nr:tRNA (N(6)-L-threonylcarbamoyladenosine(37)-C(2))-methylthiotransferase MtaB [Terriglobia bacterium]
MESFGCRASQADGDAIASGLEALGATAAAGFPRTDVVIVNTCTVTAEADRDARAYIRRVQRSNPQIRIIVTGCYAQRAPEEIAALPGVFAVVGNSHKNQVASIALAPPSRSASAAFNLGHSFVPVASLTSASKASAIRLPGAPAFVLAGDIFAHSDFQLPSLPASTIDRLVQNPAAGRTRPSLKIQDGCGNRCTFCVIPSTRGNSRSLPRRAVLDAVEEFVAAGGQELVISGINLGRWGRDLVPQQRLEYLLAEIFDTTKLPRLRISSVEPMDWTDGLISLLRHWGQGSHPRLARHVHIPLQSASDPVLRRMHRRYRPWHYAERLAKIRVACPEAAIGADVMVGFPGETDAEFQQSYDFIAAQPFTYLHLFPFSARPGTAGWELHRQWPVPAAAIRERMAALHALIDRKNLQFRSQFIGKHLSAVTLIAAKEMSDRRRTPAMTDNFLSVEVAANLESNLLVSVKITGLEHHALSGMITAQM